MNKRNIVIIIFILVSYIATWFWVSQTIEPEEEDVSLIVSTAFCDQGYISIGFTKSGGNYCLNDTSIAIHQNTDQKKIMTWKEKDSPLFVGAFSSFIIMQNEAQLTFYSYSNDTQQMAKISTVTLHQSEKVISYKSFIKENTTVLYLSIYREVETPEENKSLIIRLMLSAQGILDDKRIELTHMERIGRVYYDFTEETLVTIPMFGFVQPTFSVITYNGTFTKYSPSCPMSNVDLNDSFPKIEIAPCKDEKSSWKEYKKGEWGSVSNPTEITNQFQSDDFSINTSNENITITRGVQTKTIPNSTNGTGGWELVSNNSTTLVKTVYNCSDFGESEQISLRVCTPNHE